MSRIGKHSDNALQMTASGGRAGRAQGEAVDISNGAGIQTDSERSVEPHVPSGHIVVRGSDQQQARLIVMLEKSSIAASRLRPGLARRATKLSTFLGAESGTGSDWHLGVRFAVDAPAGGTSSGD